MFILSVQVVQAVISCLKIRQLCPGQVCGWICKFTTRFTLGKAFPNVFLGGEGKLKNSHKENKLSKLKVNWGPQCVIKYKVILNVL